jgi:branched-chain amino acid transport system ATP-binding protein
MFKINNLDAGYAPQSSTVKSLSLSVAKGEVLCLLGRNGAGKTSTLKAIMGLMPYRTGQLELDGNDITHLPPHEIPRAGVGYVPQGRRLFAELTVRQNLDIGLLSRGSDESLLEWPLSLFPALRERFSQVSGTLSGGEQQMLAMARALCLKPSLLLLDEPTEGLMPSMISAIRQVISELAKAGVSVLLVEQRIDAVISVADRVSFMENGELKHTLASKELHSDSKLVRHYVGVG